MRVEAGGPAALEWIRERTQCALTPHATCIQAVDDKGRIRGVLAFDNWTVNAVQVHQAVDAPIIWRHLIGPAIDYAYRQCGKGLLVGVTPGSNKRACDMAKRMGMREAHRIRDGWAVGEDMVVFEMRREECRWLSSDSGLGRKSGG